MIQEVTGNLIEKLDEHKAIAHGVNLKGRMGAGFALDLSRKVPGLLEDYFNYCENEKPEGGDIYIYQPERDSQIIFNLFTQEKLGYADLDFIKKSITNMYFAAQSYDIENIAMPMIGTGYGNISEHDFFEALNPFTYDSFHHVTVYRLKQPSTLEHHLTRL